MVALADLSAVELGDAYARGELSPVAVARAVFERIDAMEPRLNAMYRIHVEAAMASARESEARWQAGAPRGPLDGVPITLKENIDTIGDPTPVGTAATMQVAKTRDAPPAARVREAGCTILGKTTMPDFGMLSSGRSSIHGTTRNPWNLSLNTSGSSSGAGAAGAAGYGPLHLGTDIGGSVRLPAAHCGLFGLKPSLGRVPIDPPFMGRVTGPLTRTVADAALLLEALNRPDKRDWMCLPWQPEAYRDKLQSLRLEGLRIGVMTDVGAGLPAAPAIREAAVDAGLALEREGAIVEQVGGFLTDAMLDGICRFFEARSYNDIAAMPESVRDRVLPFIVHWCTWRAKHFSGADVMSAFMEVIAMRAAAVRHAGAFDFVLSPCSPVLSYGAEACCPGDDPENALAHIGFTVPYSMSEQPAASINWTHAADGLPVGVQVVGERFNDLGVLQLSWHLERLRGAQAPWPSPNSRPESPG